MSGIKSRKNTTPIQKPPRKSLPGKPYLQEVPPPVITSSVEPVRRTKPKQQPGIAASLIILKVHPPYNRYFSGSNYYHTLNSRHLALRRINSTESFTSLSELSFNQAAATATPRQRPGSMYNLDTTQQAAVVPPSWHKKPERFYSAFESPQPLRQSAAADKVVPELPPKRSGGKHSWAESDAR